jgi:hypothetical protein
MHFPNDPYISAMRHHLSQKIRQTTDKAGTSTAIGVLFAHILTIPCVKARNPMMSVANTPFI